MIYAQFEWKDLMGMILQEIKSYGYHLCFVALIMIFMHAKWNSQYFKRKNVKHHSDIWPFFGHVLKHLLGREHMNDLIKKCYDEFPNEKYIGFMYTTNRPYIIFKDLELIKQVMITNFDSFSDHSSYLHNDDEPMINRNLFSMKSDRWRKMRLTLNPTYSNFKLKTMYHLIAETAEQVVCYLIKDIDRYIGNVQMQIDMKDIYERYLNDVIATSTFGLITDSLNNQNNHFYKMGKLSTTFTEKHTFKFILMALFPKLMKILGIKLLDRNVLHFFRSLVLNTIKFREKENIFRPDMLNILQEARKGSHNQNVIKSGITFNEDKSIPNDWTDDDIVAQAMTFFVAGFANSSNTLCFITHELILNPHVQQKLYKEISKTIINKRGKNLSFDDISGLKYLEMVILETLRKWPAIVLTDRQCIKSFELPASEKYGYTMNPGDGIIIPIYSIHHDPKYFPDPEKFDPERFSAKNVEKIHKYSFLPFGLGPRSCIGRRFALLVIKLMIFHMVANFEFLKSEKTTFPIYLNSTTLSINPKDGLWIGLKPRK